MTTTMRSRGGEICVDGEWLSMDELRRLVRLARQVERAQQPELPPVGVRPATGPVVRDPAVAREALRTVKANAVAEKRAGKVGGAR